MSLKRRMKRNAARNASAGMLSVLAERRSTGEPRMAEVVADIAEPLLNNLVGEFDLATYDGALKAAAVLWNSRLLRIESGLVDPIAELKAALVTPTPPELERLYQEVLDRAEMLYPGLDRMIADVQVVPRVGGGYRIHVTSLE